MKTRISTPRATDPELAAANWILRRDAGVTPAEEAELQDWLAEDPHHAAALARKGKAWSALDRPLRSGQAVVLLDRLELRHAQRRRRRQVAVGAAAAAGFLLAAALLLPPGGNRLPPLEARGVVLLPETRSLPDGSAVELRPGARVDVDFDGPLRRVWLRSGTAYFAVAKDEARPFVVVAGEVAFRAIGTAFAVEQGSERVDLLVTEGRVAVERPDAANPAPATAPGGSAVQSGAQNRQPGSVPVDGRGAQTIATVGAGNRLVVGRAPAVDEPAPMPTAVSAHEMGELLAWRAPRLEFSELPLSEAVALMNRYNRVQFEIQDPAAGRLRISGLFRADNIETFVRLLEGTCGLEAQRTGDTIRLRKAGD